MNFVFNDNDVILFIGDSITDCNRNRLSKKDLGFGYVNLINYYLQQHLSTLELTCINKGMFGHRTIDLKNRWEKHCLKVAPNILSLLVGINDTWRRYDRNLLTSLEEFEANYRYLLDSFIALHPSSTIILLSPFLVPVKETQQEWYEDLNPKIMIVEKLALEYGTLYIPLQDIFNEALLTNPDPLFWTEDGVHPTLNGHGLIAKHWLKTLSADYSSNFSLESSLAHLSIT